MLFDAVGDAPVAALLRELGLPRTRIPHRCRDIAAALVADAGVEDVQGWLDADPRRLARLSVRDPARTNAGTAREMTSLLAALWADRAAAPESCAAIRRLMRLQLMAATGSPRASRTTRRGQDRHAAGHPQRDRRRRARGRDARGVAVFTRSDSPAAALPQADRAIGTRAARIAADALSQSLGRPRSPGPSASRDRSRALTCGPAA